MTRPRARYALLALFGPPAAILWLSMAGACLGDAPSDARRGLPGDSCTRTDDCEVPLRCRKNVCTDPVGSTDAGVQGDGPSADAGPWSQCDECLEGTCGEAEKACGPECQAIEACVEMVCGNLSSVGSPDEGKCQQQCQNEHPDGLTQHLAVVNCALEDLCKPPCVPYPQDYEACRNFMDKGDCADELSACKGSPSCGLYRDCSSLCTTLQECLACDDTPEGLEGKAILEAYEQCVASECTTESWIP
ncbi:hypothetical protein [Polyangium aurulentum]|uniref:hypothetical protein n=1 Tax=Polyangium aurulentum TaxID=2567896 RepID=UPI0010AE853D|nr:hypothetical protein [Polyangium aurulentum]UQA58018.1 hypothetical protein E8A73_043245 [Polyangium aurulentum]